MFLKKVADGHRQGTYFSFPVRFLTHHDVNVLEFHPSQELKFFFLLVLEIKIHYLLLNIKRNTKIHSSCINVVVRAVKKFLSSRLIMNSRRLLNFHQRHKFLRAKASTCRDILKFKVSEIAFPGVFKRYFPPRTPCCFIAIHARLGTMQSKCPWRSTTSHSSNVLQI